MKVPKVATWAGIGREIKKETKPQKSSESAILPGSIATKEASTSFNYVNVVGKGCEGWLNLFFGEYCVALIREIDLANKIRGEIKEKQ